LISSAARVVQFGRSRRSLTILDQALVSGSNFITGIILVRGLGLVEFGRFTIAYAILLLANSVQLSFISSPMITLGSLCATREERRHFVRGIYGVQLIFCAITSVLAVIGTAAYVRFRHSTGAAGFLLPFATAVVAFLMQDWLRRYYFTIGKASASFWNDAISYLGQVVVLCFLWWKQSLTMNTALWSIALTSGLAYLIGAALERLGCTREETRESWRQSHALSIDLGIANQLQWLVYQGAMLIGAGVVGAQAAGGVRATQNVVGPVNVAYQAMENIVPVRAAEEMKRGGIDRVERKICAPDFGGRRSEEAIDGRVELRHRQRESRRRHDVERAEEPAPRKVRHRAVGRVGLDGPEPRRDVACKRAPRSRSVRERRLER